jgi:hypothetical protein
MSQGEIINPEALSLNVHASPPTASVPVDIAVAEVRAATTLDAVIPWFVKGALCKRFFLFVVSVALYTVGESFLPTTANGPTTSLRWFVDDFLGEKGISLGFAGDQAEVYARCGNLILHLSGNENLGLLTSLAQMRELLPIHKDDRGNAFDLVVQHMRSANKNTLSGPFIRKVLDMYPGLNRVQRHRDSVPIRGPTGGTAYTRVLFSMENDRYGTPTYILRCVRRVLGAIDLDPFSEVLFNLGVRAARFYSRDDNGLDRRNSPWWGRVFLNPPGGKTASGESISGLALARAIYEWRHMTMVAAIVLLKAAVGYEWFNQVYQFPRCWLYSRPSFNDPNNSENGCAPVGYVAVYMGSAPLVFKQVFSSIGHVDGV